MSGLIRKTCQLRTLNLLLLYHRVCYCVYHRFATDLPLELSIIIYHRTAFFLFTFSLAVVQINKIDLTLTSNLTLTLSSNANRIPNPKPYPNPKRLLKKCEKQLRNVIVSLRRYVILLKAQCYGQFVELRDWQPKLLSSVHRTELKESEFTKRSSAI